MSSEPKPTRKEVKVTDETEVRVHEDSELRYEDSPDSLVTTSEEGDLSTKARTAGLALEDLITSVIDRAKIIAKEKTNELTRTKHSLRSVMTKS